MEPTKYSALSITSLVIPPSEDGNYSFEHAAFITPHEAIRRELMNAANALESFDCNRNPWMAGLLKEWVEDFFVPLVNAHHCLEDSVFFPIYYQLGVTLPERIAEDHISLINRLNHWKSLVTQLANEVSSKADSKDAERAVREHFSILRREIEGNFSEEEKFWPSILVKDGQVSLLFGIVGQIFNVLFGFIVEKLGQSGTFDGTTYSSTR